MMSLRSPGKLVPRLVLAAAAAASIATSAVPPDRWTLDAGEPLEPIVLDDAGPLRMHAIQATVGTGEEAARGTHGDVEVILELSARDVTGVRPAEVDVELRSDARGGELDRRTVLVSPGGRTTVALQVPAWLSCLARTCDEDYTLTLRRLPAQDDPIIDVTGTVRASFFADGSIEPPPGAAISLDVTDLGPVP